MFTPHLASMCGGFMKNDRNFCAFLCRAADVFCMSRLLLSILAFVLSLYVFVLPPPPSFHNNRRSLCSLLLFFALHSLHCLSSGTRVCVIVSNLFFFPTIFGLNSFPSFIIFSSLSRSTFACKLQFIQRVIYLQPFDYFTSARSF